MKKVLLVAIALMALVCTSCNKTPTTTKYYYSYSNEMGIHGMDNDISALTQIVDPKYGQLMQLTKDEANTEWNNFLASVANIVVTLNDNSYYTVKFNRVEEKDGQFTPVEKVGEKTWGTKPAQ